MRISAMCGGLENARTAPVIPQQFQVAKFRIVSAWKTHSGGGIFKPLVGLTRKPPWFPTLSGG